MAERIFCCCGVAGRTKLIGWSQLISFAVVMILTGVQWTHSEALRSDSENVKSSDGHDLTTEETLILEYITQIAWIEFVLSVLVGFPCILMAIILLCGAYNRNTCQLQAWMIFDVICIVVVAIYAIRTCFLSPGGEAMITVFILMIVFSIQIHFLDVVGTYKTEIKMAVNPRTPGIV